MFQDAIRDVFSARGGNDILTGRTLFVGCPFGARVVSSAGLDALSFAFFVFTDASGCSPSESERAFLLLELAARFCDIVGSMKEIEQDLDERQNGGEMNGKRVKT
jgi:hypothetical protein